MPIDQCLKKRIPIRWFSSDWRLWLSRGKASLRDPPSALIVFIFNFLVEKVVSLNLILSVSYMKPFAFVTKIQQQQQQNLILLF